MRSPFCDTGREELDRGVKVYSDRLVRRVGATYVTGYLSVTYLAENLRGRKKRGRAVKD